MGRANKRDAVLNAAEELFESDGFVATGVNQITSEAGVASMTLYNNFSNKQELVVATLERRAGRFLDAFNDAIEAAGDDPKKSILCVFDVLHEWITTTADRQTGFVGCYFLKASIEFKEPTHPAHVAAAEHKRRMIEIFEDAARQLGSATPVEMSYELHLLFDGAIMQAQVLGDQKSALRARRMAKRLIAAVS